MASGSKDEFHSSAYIETSWARKTGIKLVIFDFDKTITRKHTGGFVQVPAEITDEYMDANFADLEFFKFVVPYIRAQGVHVAIGSFGEENIEALLSGIPLLRKYLDKVFGPGKTDAGCTKSEEHIPDELIALWHPESRGQDPKAVGKQNHIKHLIGKCQEIDGNGAKPIPMSKVVLFDDDKTNIEIAVKKGIQAFFVEAVSSKDATSPTGFNRDVWRERFIPRKGKTDAKVGCSIQ